MVGPFVLDVSATLAWCFENEATAASRSLLGTLAERVVVVPELWHIELANAVLQAERRRRLTERESSDFLEMLQDLRIETDQECSGRAFGPLLALSRRHKLTSYDACYLDVAIRRRLPLATRDRELRAAARATGVPLIDT